MDFLLKRIVEKVFKEGIDVEFVQDNHSFSREVGTLRGCIFSHLRMHKPNS